MTLATPVVETLRQAEEARRRGDLTDALLFVEDAKDEALLRSGARSGEYAFCLYVQATVLEDRRDLVEAEELYLGSLHLFQESLGLEDPNTATTLHALALLQTRIRAYPGAVRTLTESLSVTADALGIFHPDYLEALSALARYHLDGGAPASAREALVAGMWTVRLANDDGRDPGAGFYAEACSMVALCTRAGDEELAAELLEELARSGHVSLA